MHVLITCKFEKDQTNSSLEKMETFNFLRRSKASNYLVLDLAEIKIEAGFPQALEIMENLENHK